MTNKQDRLDMELKMLIGRGLDLETVITCSCCGQQRKLKNMKYRGLQEDPTSNRDYALFNCLCRSTQTIPVKKGE